MPPGLISSAAPGKKATAPKAAPRRRAAAVAPPGPSPSAAGPSTSVAPPSPEHTQTQPQTPVVEQFVQQEEAARPRESDVETANHATAPPPETVAEHVASHLPAETAEAEAVGRERDSEPVSSAVLPIPEATQAETTKQKVLEEQREEEERQRQRQEAIGRQAEENSRQAGLREEEKRQAEVREAARNEQLAVEERQVAEQEEAERQNGLHATSAVLHSDTAVVVSTEDAGARSNSNYVPPSASSATPATVDPTTLPPPARPVAVSKPSAKRARADKSSTGPVRPAKKAKTSSTRSNAKVQAVVNGAEEDEGFRSSEVDGAETDAAQPKPKAKRKPVAKKAIAGRKRRMSVATIQNSDDETEGQDEQEEEDQGDVAAAMPPPKKPRKPRAKRATKKKAAKAAARTGGDEAATENEGEGQLPDETVNHDDEGETSDPELHEIDPNSISMWELSRDEHHGKKSERGKKMEDIDWDKVAQDRRDAANALVASFRNELQPQADPSDDVVASVEGPADTAELDGSGARRSQSRAPTAAPANDDLGLGFVLDADGNIVTDENTLTFTRDAAAQAAANSDAPVEDFTDLTQTFNRVTHLNANRRDPADRLPAWKSKSDPWSEDETDKFYDALRMFGTDFFIISKMFAPKTRRMIKNKFNREEKLDPNRINRALTGIVETPMSLEHYSRETGFAMEKFTKYEGVQHAQSVIDSENVGKEVVDEKEAKRREKELAREEKEREKERQKEERKAKRKAKTKKGIAEAGGAGFGGGGPVEIVVGEAE
ncbi:uncharacterized protein RCC_07476 [Ramularia collo-cygni]|uniref:Myb-like domain-containing protein n=1 Tax=Ramularia collo-cygni TaxID=112498 RepID=A0A2D3UV87_9PEZI|nr:uncharacterized protein RCC_07476 [Ramularia collo-cygni]CZT21612.1 uncharacterized protein RCC_07476 [Ramularia collo-cygni]